MVASYELSITCSNKLLLPAFPEIRPYRKYHFRYVATKPLQKRTYILLNGNELNYLHSQLGR